METKTETTNHHHHSHAENYLWRAKDNIQMAVNSIHKPECEEDVKCAIARALEIAFDCGDFDLAAEVIYESTEFAIGHYELEEEE
jgi:hypothetical protein